MVDNVDVNSESSMSEIVCAYRMLYNAKITYDEYYAICRKHNFVPLDARKEAIYLQGDNSSRESGYKYSPIHHSKGKFFQYFIKPMIIGVVNRVHSYFRDKYDEEIFVYTDPRLLFLEKFLKESIEKHVGHDSGGEYKREICSKTVDIVLGIMKEDIYYRSRLFLLLNKLHDLDVKFEITDNEKENLVRFSED